jgi:hypothetical protein
MRQMKILIKKKKRFEFVYFFVMDMANYSILLFSFLLFLILDLCHFSSLLLFVFSMYVFVE